MPDIVLVAKRHEITGAGEERPLEIRGDPHILDVVQHRHCNSHGFRLRGTEHAVNHGECSVLRRVVRHHDLNRQNALGEDAPQLRFDVLRTIVRAEGH